MRISFVKTLFPVLSVAVVFLYMSSVKWEIQTQEKQLHQVQQNFSLHSALLLNKLDKLEAHLIAEKWKVFIGIYQWCKNNIYPNIQGTFSLHKRFFMEEKDYSDYWNALKWLLNCIKLFF